VLRLVGQAALGVHALADLRHQFGVRGREFARARFDAAFQFGVRGLESVLRCLRCRPLPMWCATKVSSSWSRGVKATAGE
jgi:hypothetical protein